MMPVPRLVADCDKEGPEHCETVYNTVCETKWKVHEVVDDVTNCETVIETGDCKTVYLGRTFEQYLLELETKVHPKVRNHGEGPPTPHGK